MPGPWEVLRAAGVPEGAARRTGEGRLDPTLVASAVRDVLSDAGALDASSRECLTAWLSAFRKHWPVEFADVLGSVGEEALRVLSAGGYDPDRYLKLRRIAIANLAVLV